MRRGAVMECVHQLGHCMALLAGGRGTGSAGDSGRWLQQSSSGSSSYAVVRRRRRHRAPLVHGSGRWYVLYCPVSNVLTTSSRLQPQRLTSDHLYCILWAAVTVASELTSHIIHPDAAGL